MTQVQLAAWGTLAAAVDAAVERVLAGAQCSTLLLDLRASQEDAAGLRAALEADEAELQRLWARIEELEAQNALLKLVQQQQQPQSSAAQQPGQAALELQRLELPSKEVERLQQELADAQANLVQQQEELARARKELAVLKQPQQQHPSLPLPPQVAVPVGGEGLQNLLQQFKAELLSELRQSAAVETVQQRHVEPSTSPGELVSPLAALQQQGDLPPPPLLPLPATAEASNTQEAATAGQHVSDGQQQQLQNAAEQPPSQPAEVPQHSAAATQHGLPTEAELPLPGGTVVLNGPSEAPEVKAARHAVLIAGRSPPHSCPPCSLTFATLAELAAHQSECFHGNKVADWLLAMTGTLKREGKGGFRKVQQPTIPGGRKHAKLRGMLYPCSFCNTVMEAAAFIEHLTGARHARALARFSGAASAEQQPPKRATAQQQLVDRHFWAAEPAAKRQRP